MFTILIEPIVSENSTVGFDLLRQVEFAIAQISGGLADGIAKKLVLLATSPNPIEPSVSFDLRDGD